MKQKFSFDHAVKWDTKEVWVKCDSSITAMGLSTLVGKYYPGYTAKIATDDILSKLKSQLEN
jgi:hypothetical protein